MDKKTVGVVAGVVIIAAGLLYVLFSGAPSAEAPAGEMQTSEEMTSELEGVDLGNLDTEFQAIDEEIKGL